MDTPLSVRRLVENEVMTRRANEQAATAMKIMFDEEEPVLFFCECSDEACRDHVLLRVVDYQNIHVNRGQFIVLPGHVNKKVETIVNIGPTYTVVKKFDL